MAGRAHSLFKVFRGKTNQGPAAAPAQQPEEPEQLQPLQDGEWQSRAAGPVPVASLAPSLPGSCGQAQGQDGTGLGLPLWQPCSVPWPSGGCPCLGSAELGCVLCPLPRPLSSDCAHFLPDAGKGDVGPTEAMATTNTHRWGISKRDITSTLTAIPGLPLEFSKEKGISNEQQVSSPGPGLKGSQDGVAPQATSAGPLFL